MNTQVRRRSFLKAAAGVAAGSWAHAATAVQSESTPAGSRNSRIVYQATVPDTLDLAHRAELALHGIAGTIDPNDDYMMWFDVHLFDNPAYLKHRGGDLECTPKFLDAMTQLRLACGSEEYLDIEQGMLKMLMGCLDKNDGLYWAVYKPDRPWHLDMYRGKGYNAVPKDYAIPVTSGIMLTALLLRNDLGLTPCEDQIRALARGLEKISIQKADYAYYPVGAKGDHPFACPRSGWGNTDEPGDEHEGGEGSVTAYHGYQMRGLSMWAARSGDEQALEFAGKLARFVMKPKFWGNRADPPDVAGREQGHVDSHFHARAIALRGLLEYGIVAADNRICDFVRSAYEYIRTYGINRIGFVPCWPGTKETGMEGCMLGDLVALCIKMSDARLGDYWDDVDRIVRNHLVEAQYIRRDLIERIVQGRPAVEPKGLPGQLCFENVIERSLGIFASYLGPTSSYGRTNRPPLELAGRIMQCCTGNASRGLGYAWEGITRCSGDEAQVNLLLNRAAPWLDIDSYLPYEGKVVIRNKTARRIAVRIPAWVERSKLRATVNGNPADSLWVGAYRIFADIKPADVIRLDFPVRRETVHLTAGRGTKAQTTYAITMRGNTVVDISPRDESPLHYPMYLRDQMKADKAPMKKVQQFVSEQVARW